MARASIRAAAERQPHSPCVAVAAAVTVDLVRALTRSIPLGMMAGIGLGLTGIVWDIGTHAEAHALHLAFVAILIRLLVAWEDGRRDRSLVAAAVVFASHDPGLIERIADEAITVEAP